MNKISNEFIEHLTSIYGTQIDLKAKPGILNDILEKVKANPEIYKQFENTNDKTHDKTYTREEKGPNGNETYVQYDKTVSNDEVIKEEGLEKIIAAKLEKFRN